jgi:hypothetical protein
VNSKSLFCLLGILALAGAQLRADSDIVPESSTDSDKPDLMKDARGKYRQYVYSVVGSYWYPNMVRYSGILPAAIVRIRFTVHSDGNVSDFSVIEGKDQKEFVQICLNSVKNPSPFKPFDPALLQEVGKKYVEDYTFGVSLSEVNHGTETRSYMYFSPRS